MTVPEHDRTLLQSDEYEKTIINYLAREAAGWRMLEAPPGAWFLQEFLVRVGIVGIAQPLPAKYPPMTPTYCFQNTAILVRRRRGLRYCEGYVIRNSFPFPIHHAWAIDANDRVIDPTLERPEECQFLGFPIDLKERKKWVNRNSQSVFDTGMGRNIKFMMQHCPALLDLVADQHREFVERVVNDDSHN